MLKKLFFVIMILSLLIVGSVSAQDATPEATGDSGALAAATAEGGVNDTGALSQGDVTQDMIQTPEVTPEATAEATLPPGAFANFPGPGSYTVRQPFPEGQRSYRVYIPPSYSDDGDPFPLVVVMHGAGGTGADTEAFTGFNDLADQENFIAVYPDGLNHVWNDGRSGDPRINNVDDVHFLDNLVQYMEKMLHIDANRVYAAGYSMGGMMAYRLACALPDRFAAVASVASTMPIYLLEICDATVPIPVIVFQGTDDPIVPWTGIPNGYLSAAQTIGFWGNHNQCIGGFLVESLPDSEPTDHTLVMRQSLKDCTADMMLYGVYWGGHTWPGHPINVAELGQTSQDVDATALIWEFFNDHAKISAK